MAFHTVTLTKSETIATGTKMFWFTKPEGFTFQPGQYVAMRIQNLVAPDARAGVRSLSIASAPYEAELGFAVRESDTGFKQTLWAMQPGQTVEVTDAVGFFTVPATEEREVVFLIGGIGITPVRSILFEAVHNKDTRKYTLFYANRKPSDAPFLKELETLDLPGFTLENIISQCDGGNEHIACDEHGYISQEVLEKHLMNPREKAYYLVGSPQFIIAMEAILSRIGLAKSDWHVDPFTGLASAGK